MRLPPGDPPALARGILGVLEDWSCQQQAAVEARDRIEAEFGWRQVAGRTLDVYRAVVERRARGAA